MAERMTAWTDAKGHAREDACVQARRASMLVAGLLLAACTSSPAEPSHRAATPPAQIRAEVVSGDLYVNAPQRVAVDLVLGDGRSVSFGTARFRFSYVGTPSAPESPWSGADVTASFIPTPGTPDGSGRSPTVTSPAEARGIYEAENVTFDRPGLWEVEVTVDVSGRGSLTVLARFQVGERPELPAPGQPAPRTDNLTLNSKGVPKAAIDSRYTINGAIPDPELHETTIADAIKEHHSVLVVFSSPVYSISRFDGPVTDLIDRLSNRYADRTEFIHVEIWRECCTKQVLNRAAADWLDRDGISGNIDVIGPWVFLIGADGTILDRWNSILSAHEVAAELKRMPLMR